MDKTEAFKIVLKNLRQCNMFFGKYDARHGNTSYMDGIATVIEFIAYSINDEIGDNISKEIIENRIKSEKTLDNTVK